MQVDSSNCAVTSWNEISWSLLFRFCCCQRHFPSKVKQVLCAVGVDAITHHVFSWNTFKHWRVFVSLALQCHSLCSISIFQLHASTMNINRNESCIVDLLPVVSLFGPYQDQSLCGLPKIYSQRRWFEWWDCFSVSCWLFTLVNHVFHCPNVIRLPTIHFKI